MTCKILYIRATMHAPLHATYISVGAYTRECMDFHWNKFFHASVLPKMHFLEVHNVMVPWVQKWKAGFRMIGPESIHARSSTRHCCWIVRECRSI